MSEIYSKGDTGVGNNNDVKAATSKKGAAYTRHISALSKAYFLPPLLLCLFQFVANTHAGIFTAMMIIAGYYAPTAPAYIFSLLLICSNRLVAIIDKYAPWIAPLWFFLLATLMFMEKIPSSSSDEFFISMIFIMALLTYASLIAIKDLRKVFKFLAEFLILITTAYVLNNSFEWPN